MSLTSTLGSVRELDLKLRSPGARIEDERGNPTTIFRLKGMVAQ